MKCARCSAEIPAQSQFCLRCGTPLQTTILPAHAAPPIAAFPTPRQSNKGLITAVVVLVLAVLGLGAFMLKGMLAQQPAKSGNGQLVQAPGAAGPGTLVQAPGETHAAPVQAPADSNPNKTIQQPAPVNNADIDDYLRFVRRIDEQRQTLTKQELSAVLKMQASDLADQVEAAQDDQKGKEYLDKKAHMFDQFEPAWNDLARTFAARVPPQSCIQLRDSYYTFFGKIQGQFTKVSNAISGAAANRSGDVSTLTSMLGTASADADNAAQAADDALDDICKKYSLRKEFRIQADPSASTGTFR